MIRNGAVLIAILMLWFTGVECSANRINENAGTRGAQILKIGVGANAVGMGESYVAAVDNVYAIYWNPAGLSNVDRNQLGFMLNEWFEDIRHEFLGYVQPIGDMGTIAGSVSYVSMGELDKTDEYGNNQGKFHPYDFIIGLSFGTELGRSVSAGFSAKFLQEKIDEEKAQVMALDIGGLYHSSSNNLALGVNIRNIGTKMKFVEESFSLPLSLNIGAAYKLLDNAFTIATDIDLPSDNDANMGLGIEYRIMGIFDLRAGYRYTLGGNDLGTASGLRAGVGFGTGKYKLDYAFVPYGELGQAHRISLIASF